MNKMEYKSRCSDLSKNPNIKSRGKKRKISHSLKAWDHPYCTTHLLHNTSAATSISFLYFRITGVGPR